MASKKTLVVRDEEQTLVALSQQVHRLGHVPQRIHVQPGVDLIQNAHLALHHGQLQNFVSLLFAPGEAFVHVARQKEGSMFSCSSLGVRYP